MSKSAFVIMLNDSVRFVVIGTEEQAREKMEELELDDFDLLAACPSLDEYRLARFWHIREAGFLDLRAFRVGGRDVKASELFSFASIASKLTEAQAIALEAGHRQAVAESRSQEYTETVLDGGPTFVGVDMASGPDRSTVVSIRTDKPVNEETTRKLLADLEASGHTVIHDGGPVDGR